uniref:Rib/alpha-like domain-containing protein n=1 Tax=Streptococcus pseudopneumoniae TaxID=257758 RepID=UPI00066CFBFA
MYFNRKNAEQKNWRMIKKGKHFLFGCSLVFAVGASLATQVVHANTAETTVESNSTTGDVNPTQNGDGKTYEAPAVAAVAAKLGGETAKEVKALDKTQLENYIAEIEAKLANGTYESKTEESVAVLKAGLEDAKATLANATTQDEITKAYSKLVTTVNTKLKAKPVEKKETPEVDTTNGKETVGKKAENTEKNPESNSIENTGSNDPRNRQAIPTGIQFRAEVAVSKDTNKEPNGHSDTYILNDVNGQTAASEAARITSRVTNYKVKYNKDDSGKITSLDWLVYFNNYSENLANTYHTDSGEVYRNYIQIPKEVNMPDTITRAQYASPRNPKFFPGERLPRRYEPNGQPVSASSTFDNPTPTFASGLPREGLDTFNLADWPSTLNGRSVENLATQLPRYFKDAASDNSPTTRDIIRAAAINGDRLIVDRSTTGGSSYNSYVWSFTTTVPIDTTNEQLKDMKVVFGMMRSATAGANAAFANVAANPVKMWQSDVSPEPTAKVQTVKAGQVPDAKKSIGNLNDLPQGTTVAYKEAVDTQNSGEKPAIAVVTYPDTSKKEVPVKVIVEKEAVAVAAPVVNTNAKARNTVLSTDEELTGTGTPGATVKVTVKNPEGTTVISEKTTQVGADGNWKLGLDKGLNSNEILGGNAASNTFYAPKNKVEVTQVVNGVSSAATAVTVSEGASTILPSAAAKDGKSVVAGAKEVTVTIPHDAGIAYFWYTNKNDNSKPQIDIKREADGNFVISGNNAGKATVKNVVKGAFSDTVTLTLTEPAKEGANLEIIPHNGLATKGTYLGRANIPVTNEKPVVSSATNSDVTTVIAGGTVNLSTLAKVTDHEDDQNATLGTKGTPTVVS